MIRKKSRSLNINGIKKKLSKFTANLAELAVDFSLFPRDDEAQALRLRRFFISFGIYLINLSLSCLAYWAGIMSLHALYWNWIIIIVANLILYIVFRTGFNKRFKDPSLTALQICIASVVVMYAIFFVYEARSVLFALYVLILLFGIFRLNTKQFLGVSAFILLTYGVDVFLFQVFRSQDVDIKIELFQWVALAIVLISVSFIGGHISALRHELSSSRKKLKKSLDTIKEMAIHDDLTGFYNRRHLMELIEAEKNRSIRTSSVFSLAMLDIDHFKKINDTYGHQIGDKVLTTFSTIVRSILRKTDFCGRYGGEEFLVVLTDTDLKAARAFAERIRSAVAESYFVELGKESKMTVSIGLAESRKSENIEKTISRADEAMYKAKRNGRNRVEISD